MSAIQREVNHLLQLQARFNCDQVKFKMASESCLLKNDIAILRSELKNLRSQIRGLRATHEKDLARVRVQLNQPQPGSSRQEVKDNSLVLKPIGVARTWYKTKNGTPRQPTVGKMATGVIDLSVMPKHHAKAENPSYGLDGLAAFSHIWLLFHFHSNSTNGEQSFNKMKVAPPRLKGGKVGLFSTRSPHRPNPIGLTLAKILRVEGDQIHVQGLDLLDGTPILDIKPYIPDYDAPKVRSSNCDVESETEDEVRVPTWINQSESDLKVCFTPRAEECLKSLDKNDLVTLKNVDELREAIVDVLKADPRSNYRKDKCSDRLYFFQVDNVKVTAWFDEDVAEVIKVSLLN